MKKLLITGLVLVFISTDLFSQELERVPAQGKSGSTELMINGRPYSQYKAEQEALKQQKLQQKQQPIQVDPGMVLVNAAAAQNQKINKPAERKDVLIPQKAEEKNTVDPKLVATGNKTEARTVPQFPTSVIQQAGSGVQPKLVPQETPRTQQQVDKSKLVVNTPTTSERTTGDNPAARISQTIKVENAEPVQEKKTEEPKADPSSSDTKAKSKTD